MSENKKYYWLKLKDSFFADKRIKKLRKIAGGDTYTIIYLKMQLLSLKDEGNLYFDNVENTFEEEIALQIDEDVEDVKLTIAFLVRNNLLAIIDDDYYELPETKLCIGKEGQSAQRVRKCREKKKLKEQLALQCNTDVTKCNTEIEIEKEIEKEREIKKPTLIDIKNYIIENKLKVDADKFFKYYETGNWKDTAGQTVINWKQKLISWNNHEVTPSKKPYNDYEQREDVELENYYIN